MTNYVIVPSAKFIAPDLRKEFGHIPPVLLTYQNETILQYLCKVYRNSKILIGVHEGKQLIEQYVKKSRSSGGLIEIDQPQSLGHTVYSLLQQIDFEEVDQLTIHFGDTIIQNVDTYLANSLLVCKVDDSWRWTIVENKSDELLFMDKTSISVEKLAIVGIINIQYPLHFKYVLQKVLDTAKGTDALFVALKLYHQNYPLELVEINRQNWIDLGHLDRLVEATGQTRIFNEITIDFNKGVLKKNSLYKAKFINEILWYIHLPKNLHYAIPRIFNYSLDEQDLFIEMEYYSYRSLSERYVINNLNIEDWQLIFKRIENLLTHFSQFKQSAKDIDQSRYHMYVKKTLERLTDYDWPEELKKVSIIRTINGKEVIPLDEILDSMPKVYHQLYQHVKGELPQQFNVMHGDLCFSNILYDIHNGITRIIDPRGSFEDSSVYGDALYDLAKLSHSVRGFYDFIIRDQFYFEMNEENIIFELFSNERHQEIAQLFEQRFLYKPYLKLYIDFIESMLFLSMIPLHKDSITRQKAMLVTGILKYNQFIKLFYNYFPLKKEEIYEVKL